MEPILKCLKPLYVDRSVRPHYPRDTTVYGRPPQTQRERLFTSKQKSEQSAAKQLMKAMKRRLRQLAQIREEDIQKQLEIRRKKIQISVSLRKTKMLAIQCFILEAKKQAYMKYRHLCSKIHCKGCDKINEVVQNIIDFELWNEKQELIKKTETLPAELLIEKKSQEQSPQLQISLLTSLPKLIKPNSINLPEIEIVRRIDQYQSQPVSPSSHKLVIPQLKEPIISKIAKELQMDIQEKPSLDQVRVEPTETEFIEKLPQKSRIVRLTQRKSRNKAQKKKFRVDDWPETKFRKQKKLKVKDEFLESTYKEKRNNYLIVNQQRNLHEAALSSLKSKNNELLLKQLEMTSKKKNYFEAQGQGLDCLAMVGSEKELDENEESEEELVPQLLTNYALQKIIYKFIKTHFIKADDDQESPFDLPDSEAAKSRQGKTSMISILRRKQLKGLLNLREIKKEVKSQVENKASPKKKAGIGSQSRFILETMTLAELKEFIRRRFSADNISNTRMKELEQFYRYVQYDLLTSKERQKNAMEEHSIQAVIENEKIEQFIKEIKIQQPNLKSLQFADFEEDELEETHFSRQLRSSVTNAFGQNSIDRIIVSEKPFVRFSGDLQQMQMGTISVI